MGKLKKSIESQSNQLNLTVVALVALVAIVGLVALVLSADMADVPTGARLAQAEDLPIADEKIPENNAAGAPINTYQTSRDY